MKQDGITQRVIHTPLNELSKAEFIFRVIDEMCNCGWKAQAEYIISLVGNGNQCIGIKNNWNTIIYPKTNNNKLI